jgi:hypothetical protein
MLSMDGMKTLVQRYEGRDTGCYSALAGGMVFSYDPNRASMNWSSVAFNLPELNVYNMAALIPTSWS